MTRGIECGERGCGDESGECGFRGECGEWDGGVGCGDESDCGSGECGDKGRDGYAKGTSPSPHPHPSPHPIPNQSKPIV